jgi:hypothetical protein
VFPMLENTETLNVCTSAARALKASLPKTSPAVRTAFCFEFVNGLANDQMIEKQHVSTLVKQMIDLIVA